MDSNLILLTGARGAGKSILVRRLLAENRRPLRGFFTENQPLESGEGHRTYLYPAHLPRQFTRDNLVALYTPAGLTVFPQVFDTLGCACLEGVSSGDLVVMDELGFLEGKSPAFLQAVLTALDGPAPVLAVVKDRRDVPFLDAVRSHPSAQLYTVTPDTRQALFRQLRPWMAALAAELPETPPER